MHCYSTDQVKSKQIMSPINKHEARDTQSWYMKAPILNLYLKTE